MAVRVALFDFDGTISTLRCGWEDVMAPMMREVLEACGLTDARAVVNAYIDASCGIQTILQMKWLAEKVRELGFQPLDPWAYKDEYNRRLMSGVEGKVLALEAGTVRPDEYLISGAVGFLKGLRARGVRVLAASGTDDCDVRREARALGVYDLFDALAGAPYRAEGCAKEAALRRLAAEAGLTGDAVAVVGDGRVEIALGRGMGARCVGLASDERARRGIDPQKRARLLAAGADRIAGDFEDAGALYRFFDLAESV